VAYSTSTGELHERFCAPFGLLIVGRGHLEQVLRVYVQHYNAHRAHRALGQQPPDPAVGPTLTGKDQPARVRRHDLLGGLVHEYRHAA
jgi:putative transposase